MKKFRLKSHGSAPSCAHFNLLIADARLEAWLRESGRPVERAPVFERIPRAMPGGTTNAAVYQRPFRQRPAHMRAGFHHRMNLSVPAREQHAHTVSFPSPHLSFGQTPFRHYRGKVEGNPP